MTALVLATAALVLLGAGIVLEALAEVSRLRRLARSERASWLEASAASQSPVDSHNRCS